MDDKIKKKQDLQNHNDIIESPTDINIGRCKKIHCEPLAWHNYDLIPRKIILTNTGKTVMISAAWIADRPFIEHGSLLDKYDFYQLHFHWGQCNTSGSEHSADGVIYPMEMHISHFKRSYLFPNIAEENDDGIVIVTYLLKLQFWQNPQFENLTKCLKFIKNSKTTHRMNPFPLSDIIKYFNDDFFTYNRTIIKSNLPHNITWIISRQTLGISDKQVNEFRALLDASNIPINQYKNEIMTVPVENLYHINPSMILFTTLYPLF